MTLTMNFSRKNLHAGNPDLFHLGFAPVDRRKLRGIDPAVCDPLGKGSLLVIAVGERVARRRVQAIPQFFLPFIHVELVRAAYMPNEKPKIAELSCPIPVSDGTLY